MYNRFTLYAITHRGMNPQVSLVIGVFPPPNDWRYIYALVSYLFWVDKSSNIGKFRREIATLFVKPFFVV